MKRVPTEEQKAKAAERRERFRQIAKQVSQMTDEQRAAMTIKIGAVMTCQGHALSLNNTIILMMQIPNVSVVGGFRQWLSVGRAVKKGEHGAMIWVRTGNKTAVSDTPTTDCPNPTGQVEDESRFLIGTVFDISQTMEVETGKEELAA